jgi:hypothetical protein
LTSYISKEKTETFSQGLIINCTAADMREPAPAFKQIRDVTTFVASSLGLT